MTFKIKDIDDMQIGEYGDYINDLEEAVKDTESALEDAKKLAAFLLGKWTGLLSHEPQRVDVPVDTCPQYMLDDAARDNGISSSKIHGNNYELRV